MMLTFAAVLLLAFVSWKWLPHPETEIGIGIFVVYALVYALMGVPA